jgi:hypothetical protein
MVMKGQMNLGNLVELFFTSIFFCVAVIPITVVLINSTVITLQATPQPYTDAMVFLLQLVPIGEALAILVLVWFFGVPHQEQRYG